MPGTAMHKLLAFSQKHSIAVIAATVIVTVVFGYFALRIKLNSDIESLIPQNNDSNRLMDKYAAGLPKGDYFVVTVTPKSALSVDSLAAFHDAVVAIESMQGVQPAIDPFSYLTFVKSEDNRISVVPLSQGEPVPSTPEQVAAFEKNVKSDPFAKNLIVSADGSTLAALFLLSGVRDDRAFLHRFTTVIAPLDRYFTVHYTGTIPFSERTRMYLIRDLPKLLLLAALVILVMYYIGFRAKRAVILPLLVVTMGTVWCLGLMSIMGFELTIVSVITPPLVLTLGSSYSIHILNQYYREAQQNPREKTEIINSVDHVNKTILLAAGTTVFGFLSLLPASLVQLREFGVATSIGILSCAVLSLFFFPAVLSHLKVPSTFQTSQVFDGFLARAMAALSRFVVRARYVIIAVFAAIIAAFCVSLPHISYQTDYVKYFPSNDSVVHDLDFINEKFDGFQQMYLTVSAPNGEKNYFLRRDALEQVAKFEAKLHNDPDVVYEMSFVSYLRHLNRIATGNDDIPRQPGLTLLLARYLKAMESQSGGDVYKAIITPDFSRMTISYRLFDTAGDRLLTENDLRRELANIRGYAAESFDPSLNPEVWGSSLRYLDLSRDMKIDQSQSTAISIGLIFLLTAFSFRSAKYGLFTLLPLATGIMVNYVLMVLARIPLDLTTVMFSSVAIGVGVDDSIHFVLQFQQRRAEAADVRAAVTDTLGIAGRPIVLTTASIVGGLLILLFGNFEPIIFFGLLVTCALVTTMLGTLILLPAVLCVSEELRRRRSSAAS